MRMILFQGAKRTYRRSSIHYGMFAHEPSLGIIKDDKLDWLIDPSIAEAELNAFIGPGDCTVPQTTRELDCIRGNFGVEAYNKGRGMNGVDDVSVVRVGAKVLIVLENVRHRPIRTNGRDTHLSPDISVRCGQCTDGGVFIGSVIQDLFDLSVERLAPIKIRKNCWSICLSKSCELSSFPSLNGSNFQKRPFLMRITCPESPVSPSLEYVTLQSLPPVPGTREQSNIHLATH